MKLIFSACICVRTTTLPSREESPRRIIASDSTLHEIMLYWLLWKQFGQLCAAGGYARVLFGSIVCISDNSLEFGPADNGSIPCLAWLSGSSLAREIYFADLTNIIIDSFPLSGSLPQAAALALCLDLCICFKCHMSPCAVFCSSARQTFFWLNLLRWQTNKFFGQNTRKRKRSDVATIYPFLARRDSERKDDARINRQWAHTAPNCSLSRREISLWLGVKREIMLLAARHTRHPRKSNSFVVILLPAYFLHHKSAYCIDYQNAPIFSNIIYFF